MSTFPDIIKVINSNKRFIKKPLFSNIQDKDLNGYNPHIVNRGRRRFNKVRSCYRLEAYVNIERLLENKIGTTFFYENIVKFLVKENKIIILGAINKEQKCWNTILIDPVLADEKDINKFFSLFDAKTMMDNGFNLRRSVSSIDLSRIRGIHYEEE